MQKLNAYIIQGWPNKKEVEHSMRHYWPPRSELAITDGTIMKGKNHMGIEKMRFLVPEFVY